jgi:hypothetical protein
MLNAYVAVGFVCAALFLVGWVTYRYAPEVGRNPWFGFGTDWAQATEGNWLKANRLAGQGFMMTAVAVAPTALLFMTVMPAELAPVAVIVATLLNCAVGLRWVVSRCR